MVWGVLGGGALFWGAATVLHVFAALLLSLRIYYVGQFRLGAYAHARTQTHTDPETDLVIVAHTHSSRHYSVNYEMLNEMNCVAEKASLAVAARGLRALPGGAARARPLYAARLVLLLIANAVNWAFALYG